MPILSTLPQEKRTAAVSLLFAVLIIAAAPLTFSLGPGVTAYFSPVKDYQNPESTVSFSYPSLWKVRADQFDDPAHGQLIVIGAEGGRTGGFSIRTYPTRADFLDYQSGDIRTDATWEDFLASREADRVGTATIEGREIEAYASQSEGTVPWRLCAYLQREPRVYEVCESDRVKLSQYSPLGRKILASLRLK